MKQKYVYLVIIAYDDDEMTEAYSSMRKAKRFLAKELEAILIKNEMASPKEKILSDFEKHKNEYFYLYNNEGHSYDGYIRKLAIQ